MTQALLEFIALVLIFGTIAGLALIAWGFSL